MKHPRTSILTTLIILTCNMHLWALDTLEYRLPRITITTNRYEKDAFETHIPVQTLDKSLIMAQGQSTLGEFIDQLPGVTLQASGPWSQKPVIRGLSGAHVLTLVDGMKLDVLRAYGSHAPLVDVDQIARIEVIRGPGSVLYGSNAVAGVVNIITKQAPRNNHACHLKSSIGLQYHSVNKQTSKTLTVLGKYDRTDLLVNLTHRKADDIKTPSGTLTNSAFSGYTVDSKIGYTPTRNQTLSFAGSVTRFDNVGVPISPYARKAHFTQYDRNRVSAAYRWERQDQRIRNVRANAWYQQGNREFDAHLVYIPKGALFVNNQLNARRHVRTYGATLQSGLSMTQNHLITWGLDLFGEADDTRRISDAIVVTAANEIKMDPPADHTPPTPKSDRRGWAVFIEDELNLTKRLTLNSGLRYDAIQTHADGTAKTLTPEPADTDHSDFSGGLGAVLKLGADTRITANIGRTFKAPTLQERYFRGTAQVGYLEGNPDLKSETSLNLDLGMKMRHDQWRFSVHGFRNAIDDYIVMKPVRVTADSFMYDNVGKALLYGAELEADYQPISSFRISGNLAYVRAKDTELDENLPKIPPLNGLLALRYSPAFNEYWIELQGQFTGKQDKVAENEAITDGYHLLHISAGINLQTVFSLPWPMHLTLNIRNLLNESYRHHLSTVTWWDAPGRNIILGLRGEF